MSHTVCAVCPFSAAQQCDTSSSSSLAVLYVTLIEKAVLVLGSVILTFLTRNVPSKFNETPYLASAIYNCALMLCFIVPIVASGIGGRSVSYAVRVFGIDALVLGTLSIVFVPKLYLMWGVEERRLKEMEKLNPHAGDTNTDSGGTPKQNKLYGGSKLQNGSQNSSPTGPAAVTGRVHPVNSRMTHDGKTETAHASSSRTSVSNETTGKFLHPPVTGKESPHSVSSTTGLPGRSLPTPSTGNRFARPPITSNAFVKAEPLPGQLDGHTGQQSDIQPLMANETGEDARQPSSSATGSAPTAAEQQRRGSVDDETDLLVDEGESVSALVSKSLRLTQRLTQFQTALDSVNKELDKRKKGKSPMQPAHTLPDSSDTPSHSSEADSPLQSGR